MKTFFRAELQCPYIHRPGSETITSDAPFSFHDSSAFCARNLIGALVPECGRVFAALANGVPIEEVRRLTLEGGLFTQSARTTRQRFWQTIHYRYLRGPAWVIEDLCEAVREGERSPSFLSLLLVHYVLGDALTYELVTGFLWNRWRAGEPEITVPETVAEIRRIGSGHTRITRLTKSSLERLATMILGSLRDFGLLHGAKTKRLAGPAASDRVVRHLARILVADGVRGRDILADPAWRILLLGPDEVAQRLHYLAQRGEVQFERVGTTVVFIPPVAWLEVE